MSRKWPSGRNAGRSADAAGGGAGRRGDLGDAHRRADAGSDRRGVAGQHGDAIDPGSTKIGHHRGRTLARQVLEGKLGEDAPVLDDQGDRLAFGAVGLDRRLDLRGHRHAVNDAR